MKSLVFELNEQQPTDGSHPMLGRFHQKDKREQGHNCGRMCYDSVNQTGRQTVELQRLGPAQLVLFDLLIIDAFHTAV
jgi:hypothetical protein